MIIDFSLVAQTAEKAVAFIPRLSKLLQLLHCVSLCHEHSIVIISIYLMVELTLLAIIVVY